MSTQNYPVSPNLCCHGLVYFPRLLDKIRHFQAGTLPADYHANLGKAMDAFACQFLHIEHADVAARVADGLSDEAVLDWCFANGRRPNAFETKMFNEFMAKRGFRDEMTERLAQRKAEANASGRDDIQTFFDYIDFDEKRR